jgi:hypothetical protein
MKMLEKKPKKKSFEVSILGGLSTSQGTARKQRQMSLERTAARALLFEHRARARGFPYLCVSAVK